jgi:hypothetical protein
MPADFSPQALSKEFCSCLDAACPDLRYSLATECSPILTIPAQHPEVGGITVWFDGEEVTVGIGEFYHLHFDCFTYGPGKERAKDPDGVRKAVDWVRAFLDEAIVLEICMVDGRYYGGSTYRKDDFRRADVPSNARLFTCSGPWKGRSIEGAS